MLTDTQVNEARPEGKEYRLADERGLLLAVRPNAAEWLRLRYRFQGPEEVSGHCRPTSPYLTRPGAAASFARR